MAATPEQPLNLRSRRAQLCNWGDVQDWLNEELELDEIDPYFYAASVDVPPDAINCAEDNDDVCYTTVYDNVDVNATNPLENATSQQVPSPCSRCQFVYPSNVTSFCFNMTCANPTVDGKCDGFDNDNRRLDDTTVGAGESETNATVPDSEQDEGAGNNSTTDGVLPEADDDDDDEVAPGEATQSVVEICTRQTRADSFSSTTFRSALGVSCSRQTAKKVYGVEYLQGVVNVRQTTLIIGDTVGLPDSDEADDFFTDDDAETLEACELWVDDVMCNSCRFCDIADAGVYELDCSNIKAGATTSCDSFTDILFGIDPFSGYSP